jgi:hypothetical protein
MKLQSLATALAYAAAALPQKKPLTDGNGPSLQIFNCSTDPAISRFQYWSTHADTTITLNSTGLCIDVDQYSIADEATVWTYTCHQSEYVPPDILGIRKVNTCIVYHVAAPTPHISISTGPSMPMEPSQRSCQESVWTYLTTVSHSSPPFPPFHHLLLHARLTHPT